MPMDHCVMVRHVHMTQIVILFRIVSKHIIGGVFYNICLVVRFYTFDSAQKEARSFRKTYERIALFKTAQKMFGSMRL